MNELKVMLFNPCDWIEGMPVGEPVFGLASVAAYLDEHGISVQGIDTTYPPEKVREKYLKIDLPILKQVLDFNPDFIGMTCLTNTRHNAYFWATEFKKRLPSVKIVLGGVHATYDPVGILKYRPEIDFVVLGEGEETMLELYRHVESGASLSRVNGIAYRDGDGVKVNEPRKFFPDLSILPQIRRDLFLPESAYSSVKVLALIAGRGCPGNCKFCISGKLWDHCRRLRPVSAVKEEIETWLVKFPNTEKIMFRDLALFSSREWSMELLDYLKFKGIPWECWCKMSFLDEPLVKKMVEANCYRVRVGIETGSKKLQRELRKNVPLDRVPETMKMMRTAGLTYSASFILWLPNNTSDDFFQTIDLMRNIHLDPLNSTVSTETWLFPGTDYFNEWKIQNPDFEWENVRARFLSMDHQKDIYGNYIYPVHRAPEELKVLTHLMGVYLRHSPGNTIKRYGYTRILKEIIRRTGPLARGFGISINMNCPKSGGRN